MEIGLLEKLEAETMRSNAYQLLSSGADTNTIARYMMANCTISANHARTPLRMLHMPLDMLSDVC
ncbi:hypothetical protein N7530_004492 [Penicillium desertorum]|uniref:Uncharacterized protein n=1 Tax=Penicillium desertorum TaxID=1303715 RepID=A0A9W9WYB1_9EURO|nr:hypothetical protein N7530_004492 [Penicillium desertorum]